MSADTPDEDEAVPTPEDLIDRLAALEQHLEALSNWKDSTREQLWALEDEVEALQADVQQLSESLEDVAATAEQAMTVASRGHDPDGKSQTQAATEVTRDELVRRAGKSVTGPARKLTVREVQDLVDRDYGIEPAWAVVDRAWRRLTNEWPQFEVAQKNGDKALRLRAEHVTTALVRTVETSLERDDLAKRFGGAEGGEGDAE
jgi:regulator of replication initiation timing